MRKGLFLFVFASRCTERFGQLRNTIQGVWIKIYLNLLLLELLTSLALLDDPDTQVHTSAITGQKEKGSIGLERDHTIQQLPQLGDWT
jgi:hypothetical protein